MYKAGQIVTIKNRQYRVTKIPNYSFLSPFIWECETCDLGLKTARDICLGCLTKNLIPAGCNLKLIQPKKHMG